MAFRLLQDVYTAQTRRAILDNSLTVKVGDVIAPLSASNAVTNATALVTTSFYALGVVVGFSKANGEVIGTGLDPANTPNQLVTASDNLTVNKYHAVYIPLTEAMEFSADLDAAAGTTSGSDEAYVYFNLASAGKLGESSVVVFNAATAPLQFLSYGVDPENSSRVIGRFAKGVFNRLAPASVL